MPLHATEWPALSGSAADRLILRDGSVAVVRATTPADRLAIQKFFHDVSPEARYRRFFAMSEPAPQLIADLADSSDPANRFTLLALRHHAQELQPIAVASYAATGNVSAEVAFAVADDLHGKGLGTALLERLATLAHRHGFERFEAEESTREAEFSARGSSAGRISPTSRAHGRHSACLVPVGGWRTRRDR